MQDGNSKRDGLGVRLHVGEETSDGAWQRHRDEAVPDQFGLVYWIMMLIGVGSLLSWNALITPISYLQLRIKGSVFETSFESMFTSTFTITCLLTLLAMQKLQNHVSLRVRILGSLALLFLVFFVLTGTAIAPLMLDESVFLDRIKAGSRAQFLLLMASGVLCGIGQGILSGSAMAYASIFARPKYLQAVSVGQGVAGMAVTITSLFISLPGITRSCAITDDGGTVALGAHSSLAAGGDNSEQARDIVTAAAVYFGAACCVLFICTAGFFLVERLPFTHARLRLAAADALSNEADTAEPFARDSSDLTAPLERVVPSSALVASASSSINGSLPADGSTIALISHMWKWSFSVGAIYVVTIAIFPALTSTIVAVPPFGNSSSAEAVKAHCEWSHLFVPLGFVLFNVGDTVGRNMPCIIRSPNAMLAAVFVRIIFAPLFMLCYTEAGGGMQLPVFPGDDALALIFIGFFSVSNGWLTSSIFVASQESLEPQLRNRAASLLVCLLNGGIALGASLSFLVRYIDCSPSASNGFDCNPFISPPLNISTARYLT